MAHKYMKWDSTTVLIRRIQTELQFKSISQSPNWQKLKSDDVKYRRRCRRRRIHACWRDVNWYRHSGPRAGINLVKLEQEVPSDYTDPQEGTARVLSCTSYARARSSAVLYNRRTQRTAVSINSRIDESIAKHLFNGIPQSRENKLLIN